MNTEIDYSAVVPPAASTDTSEWEPPFHKFFGRRLENGRTEKEPIYSYKEFPAFVYAMKNGKISAKIVHSADEVKSLGEGWEKSPAAFGLVSAPSFEQNLQGAEEPARRGRPPKE